MNLLILIYLRVLLLIVLDVCNFRFDQGSSCARGPLLYPLGTWSPDNSRSTSSPRPLTADCSAAELPRRASIVIYVRGTFSDPLSNIIVVMKKAVTPCAVHLFSVRHVSCGRPYWAIRFHDLEYTISRYATIYPYGSHDISVNIPKCLYITYIRIHPYTIHVGVCGLPGIWYKWAFYSSINFERKLM